MSPRHLVDRHTRYQRFRNNPALEPIRPSPLARRANSDLHTANVLHMVLYMSYQRRLLPKSTLGNELADQAAIRKVGAAHRLQYKSHRRTLHRRYLVEALAVAALRASNRANSILVVPASWDHSIRELSDLCRDLRISGVRIASFDFTDDRDPKFTYEDE